MLGIYLFYLTCLINTIQNEHKCKILYSKENKCYNNKARIIAFIMTIRPNKHTVHLTLYSIIKHFDDFEISCI